MVVVAAFAIFGVLRMKRSHGIWYAEEAEAYPAKRSMEPGDAVVEVVEVMPMKDVGGRLRASERTVDSEGDGRRGLERANDEG